LRNTMLILLAIVFVCGLCFAFMFAWRVTPSVIQKVTNWYGTIVGGRIPTETFEQSRVELIKGDEIGDILTFEIAGHESDLPAAYVPPGTRVTPIVTEPECDASGSPTVRAWLFRKSQLSGQLREARPDEAITAGLPITLEHFGTYYFMAQVIHGDHQHTVTAEIHVENGPIRLWINDDMQVIESAHSN